MGGEFGASVGKISDSGTSVLKNEFRNIPDVSIAQYAQDSRVLPRDLTSGVMRGTQRIVNTDGSYITLGVIPDTTEFGIAFFDRDGNMIAKSNGVTDYKYDLDTGKNYYQNGKLPDGSYGGVYAKAGYDVADGVS